MTLRFLIRVDGYHSCGARRSVILHSVRCSAMESLKCTSALDRAKSNKNFAATSSALSTNGVGSARCMKEVAPIWEHKSASPSLPKVWSGSFIIFLLKPDRKECQLLAEIPIDTAFSKQFLLPPILKNNWFRGFRYSATNAVIFSSRSVPSRFDLHFRVLLKGLSCVNSLLWTWKLRHTNFRNIFYLYYQELLIAAGAHIIRMRENQFGRTAVTGEQQ